MRRGAAIGRAGSAKQTPRETDRSKVRALQSKGDRDYFLATVGLPQGQVYLSEINLNQEEGVIQEPHVRTLRAATRVDASDGEPFGMVVINMDLGKLLDDVTSALPPGVQAFVANDAGDYLAHTDPSRSFGFDLGRRYTIDELQQVVVQRGGQHFAFADEAQ